MTAPIDEAALHLREVAAIASEHVQAGRDDATADDAAAQVIAAMIQAQPALDGRLEAEAIQAPGPLT